jgi:hypothetical protein
VEPGDAEELAAALRCLLGSPAERDRLSAAAWQRVQERFTWSAVARATVAEYERAIAAQRRAGGQDRTGDQAPATDQTPTGNHVPVDDPAPAVGRAPTGGQARNGNQALSRPEPKEAGRC